MAMDLKEIESLIKEALSDATVEIQDLAGEYKYVCKEWLSDLYNG